MSDEIKIISSDGKGRTYFLYHGKTYCLDEGIEDESNEEEFDDEEDWEDLEYPEDTDLGEILTTWKENGEIEVNFAFMRNRGKEGVLLTREAVPELSDDVLSQWDVFLRYRDGRVEVLFGDVQNRRVLPDDDPHYYEAPIDWMFDNKRSDKT